MEIDPHYIAPTEASVVVSGPPTDVPIGLVRKNNMEAFDLRFRFYDGSDRKLIIRVCKWFGDRYHPKTANARCGITLRPDLIRPMIEALEKAEASAKAQGLIPS